LLFVLAAGLLVVTSARAFPRGLIVVGILVLALAMLWAAVRRRGVTRGIGLVAVGLLLAGSVAVLVRGEVLVEALVAIVALVGSVVAARRAFLTHVPLPAAVAPSRAVMVWNPRSGGGKALAAHLDEEARARGIEPIELRPGDDLLQLVLDAVAAGADALAAAGGDGTQALVASIAAEHDLPFACIPAGTRNHFALDLGVDRDDVVGALDALVCGGERRVDLAEVNGRVFVNNASLGLYAETVQRAGYRDAKLRTMLDTAPEFVGTAPSGDHDLRYLGPGGGADERAIVVLVSNNSYRLGKVLGSGTRPRIDDGRLGIAALATATAGGTGRPVWRQWEAETFVVDAGGPVPVGVDGEALMIEPPLKFTIRPGALRVRIAPQHPGASPSAAVPDGLVDGIRRLVRVVRTGDTERS
jgi:diacylglycerol kinase family enzyme